MSLRPHGAANAPSYSMAAPPFASTPMAPGLSLAAPADARTLRVLFTGSGSEYFRIWIVNLLLSIVTLSLYLPFAKARRLGYFHGNTRIGDHALGFHGDPWKMLRGHLLMLGLAGAYTLASYYSPFATLIAVLIVAAAWPALWRTSMQFRLGNTSWRGLRFGFDGDLRGAYLALLPLFVPAVAMLALVALAGTGTPDNPGGADQPQQVLFPVVMLAALALWPWAVARIRRYQHGHYRYGNRRSALLLGTGAFYGLAGKTLGVGLLVALAGAAIGPLAHFLFDLPWSLALMVSPVVIYLGLLLVLLPYWTGGLQNLVWGATTAPGLRMHSRLALRPLITLQLKNSLLTIVTLGLYWPFAAVATTRLRLQALSLQFDGDIDLWQGDGVRRFDDGSGDAAGDFFGIDVGL